MYTVLILLGLFSINISHIHIKGMELYVTKTAHGSCLLLHRSFRQANFPTTTEFRGIYVLLLLCGDISPNPVSPSPVSFGVINC